MNIKKWDEIKISKLELGFVHESVSEQNLDLIFLTIPVLACILEMKEITCPRTRRDLYQPSLTGSTRRSTPILPGIGGRGGVQNCGEHYVLLQHPNPEIPFLELIHASLLKDRMDLVLHPHDI